LKHEDQDIVFVRLVCGIFGGAALRAVAKDHQRVRCPYDGLGQHQCGRRWWQKGYESNNKFQAKEKKPGSGFCGAFSAAQLSERVHQKTAERGLSDF
jgi:hypothetical protein